MNQIDQSENVQTLQTSDELAATLSTEPGNVNKPKSLADEELLNAVFQRSKDLSKSEMTMFSMVMRTALAEVSEYTQLIKTAKTQAKRDFYQKKIAKVTKRLKRLLP